MPADPQVAHRVVLAVVTIEPISADECARLVGAEDAGAVVSFSGVVRDHDHDRAVLRLAYTAHPDAGAALAHAADQIARRHPEVRIAVAHRVGDLAIGDTALACAVSAAHRAEAFAACSDLVDEVKRVLPVWKEQHFADGTSEWVGSA